MKRQQMVTIKPNDWVRLAAGFALAGTVIVIAQPATSHEGHHQSYPAQQNQPTHQNHQHPEGNKKTDSVTEARGLSPLPANLPQWMDNKQRNHIYRKRGAYNDDVYNVRSLALDLNAVAVGHALAYQDLVTGNADRLEIETFNQINWVLKHPPRFMPDEANISATFGRKYGVLEQVFDWTHILHAQTVDVLASTDLTDAEKEAEIDRLYRFYVEKVPYAITALPMNMGYLDSQPYSKAFRQKYPKVNGLFWGYHWLQGKMYDTLYGKTLGEQRTAYDKVGKQYHEIELYRSDRPFMPMFAEVSPRFAARFPYIANTFDNLHMLHDLVNDILASEWMTEKQQEAQIQRVIWMVMAANHEGMEPGKQYGNDGLHDHRFMEGMPGMGLMPEGIMHHHDHGSMTPSEVRDDTNHEGHRDRTNHEHSESPENHNDHEGHQENHEHQEDHEHHEDMHSDQAMPNNPNADHEHVGH